MYILAEALYWVTVTRTPFSSQIVLSLMKALLGKGCSLTTDNHYYSPQLADTLIGNKSTFSTLWLNRKEVSKDLQKKKLKEEIVACQEG
jgi:hypothetical protein